MSRRRDREGRRSSRRPRFSIRLRALGVYLFALAVAYLAAAYLGSFFVALFIVLFLLPVVSLVFLFVSYSGIRCHQHFNSDRPVKGQAVRYTCTIENDSPLPIPHCRVVFKPLHPELDVTFEPFVVYLPGHSVVERSFDTILPYRGIYTMGLEVVELSDLLQLFTIRPRTSHRTFYVYPRILPLKQFAPGSEERAGTAEHGERGGMPDYSLFNQLREYRQGEPIRHMAWKKFAATGKPVIKEFESTAEPAVCIYLDSRAPRENRLAVEDVSVEIVVALVYHFLRRNIPVSVRSAGEQLFSFNGFSASQFDGFYRSTFDLNFSRTFSPVRLYRSDVDDGAIDTRSVLFVTHAADPELFALAEEAQSQNLTLTVIYNRSGEILEGGLPTRELMRENDSTLSQTGTENPQDAREQSRRVGRDVFAMIRNRGGRVVAVDDADSIITELEGEQHGYASA